MNSKKCVKKLIWQPPQLSDYRPPPFVGWPQRMWWEWPLGERLRRDKDCKRGNERRIERVKGARKEREGEKERAAGGSRSQLMWCESASDHLVLLLHPLALSLSICSTLSFFGSHLNSSPSASLHCDVGFRSAITTEMRQSGPTHTLDTQTHTHTQVKSVTAS